MRSQAEYFPVCLVLRVHDDLQGALWGIVVSGERTVTVHWHSWSQRKIHFLVYGLLKTPENNKTSQNDVRLDARRQRRLS